VKGKNMLCIDKYLHVDLLEEGARLAVAENPENEPRVELMMVDYFHPTQLALLTDKKWKNGRVLTVYFMDGTKKVQDKVMATAQQLSQFANIKFNFVKNSHADIRISFKEQGSWSYVGTDNLAIPKNQPTMNFGWLQDSTPNNDYYVVLHEFGHALGCIHEHQSPSSNIKWNKPYIYEYFKKVGWTKSMVDSNIFMKYGQNMTQFTTVDPKSIMMYYIPKEWTLDGWSSTVNTSLSVNDIGFLNDIYPKDDIVEHWRISVQQAADILNKVLDDYIP